MRILAALLLLLCPATPARAGMPSFTFRDITGERLDSISFFLVALLILAFLIQRLWNYVARDFPKLPRMNYGRALAATTLWGILFILVLTMISGARELMTPGAWEKKGLTYRLKDGDR